MEWLAHPSLVERVGVCQMMKIDGLDSAKWQKSRRSKFSLRGEDYAWAPILGSFDKLREVGVLFYLFYPLFKCFVMLELI